METLLFVLYVNLPYNDKKIPIAKPYKAGMSSLPAVLDIVDLRGFDRRGIVDVELDTDSTQIWRKIRISGQYCSAFRSA
jgi:hypothetical protein